MDCSNGLPVARLLPVTLQWPVECSWRACRCRPRPTVVQLQGAVKGREKERAPAAVRGGGKELGRQARKTPTTTLNSINNK